jgi:starch synthase (maltosyl-transferring)
MTAETVVKSGSIGRLVGSDLTAGLSSRPIVIQNVSPQLDCGRHPVKREVGDVLEVSADIFRDGHDKLTAVVLIRRKDEAEWREVPMTCVNPGLDLWSGSVRLEDNTSYIYTVEAWTDVYGSWSDELEKKLEAKQVVSLELLEGKALIADAADRANGSDAERMSIVLRAFAGADDAGRAELMLDASLRAAMARWPDRSTAIRYDRELEVFVDRVEARFAAWYEMFHRSQGTEPGVSATFYDCEERLPEIKAMGFDVIYFVPIHPIGRLHRKGPNNTLTAGPDDPGSPYAIGSKEGGHKDVHPDLGTLEDFRRFVRACHAQGMEVALDFAIQCAPDHPWVTEHPEWFVFRPDGTIKYAENPPKKYQDIVNVNFYGPHQDALWQELLSVVLFWVEQGVKIFRVDNPHTKPMPFWEWLIREVRERDPEVIFLAEAFTRPPVMKMLAKVGYSQSYTYFTWRNFKQELTDYLTELTQTSVKEYLRPNFFTNTPDINPPFLQTGGRPAHQIRFVLASTLSTVYGIYNGFELCEATPIPGKEEYLNSEKFEYKVWDWDRPGNIKDFITAVNRIRRENPALHELENLRFYPADDDNVLFYGKMTPDRSNMVFIAVNLDPFDEHEAGLEFPIAEMGLETTDTFEVVELLTGARHLWRGSRQRVVLDPEVNPCAIYRVGGWEQVDYLSPCF